jgi:hypothetical protein
MSTRAPLIKFLAAPIVLAGFAFPCALFGQAAPNQPQQLADAIAAVKSGDFFPSHVEVITKAKAVQAIPILEEQFARTQDETNKGKIASSLVTLGDKDNTYWNYLLQQATLAVDSDLPFPIDYAQADKSSVQFPPDLIAWAKAHNVSANSAAEGALYDLPGKLLLLGSTGEPRGTPLLQRALLSRNPLIVVAAAKGLAQSQDKDSIPLIIAACRANPTLAALIAEPLVYFDDPRAQRAVDTYIPKDRAKILRDAKAQGSTPFGF